MSVFGYLWCLDCRVYLWLGKAFYRPAPAEDGINFFDRLISPLDTPPELRAKQVQRTYALAKMLTEHPQHTLQVVLDSSDEWYDLQETEAVEIGGTMILISPCT